MSKVEDIQITSELPGDEYPDSQETENRKKMRKTEINVASWWASTRVDRTTPGSENDYRITYDTDSQKWTDDFPGDGISGKVQKEIEEALKKPGAKKAMAGLEGAALAGDKDAVAEAVDALVKAVGKPTAKKIVARLEDVEKGDLKEMQDSKAAAKTVKKQGDLVDSLKYAKKILGSLNPSEALFGFAGWLTTRDEAVTMGAQHDCAIVAELVGEFIEANDLPEPRGRWERELNHPKSVEAGEQKVIERIEENIRNDAIADRLIQKVEEGDDLDLPESGKVYAPVNYGEDVQLSKKRKLDIEWSDHAEYRSDLRNIEPNKVNDFVEDRLRNKLKPREKGDRAPKLKSPSPERWQIPGIGKVVVDYDITKKPSEADVVTVMT